MSSELVTTEDFECHITFRIAEMPECAGGVEIESEEISQDIAAAFHEQFASMRATMSTRAFTSMQYGLR